MLKPSDKNYHIQSALFLLVSSETRPASRFQPSAPGCDQISTYIAASRPPMDRQDIFKTLMNMMSQPTRSRDGRLMDEDGYFNEDGSRSFS
jgi:hypothetical protein